MTFPHPVTFATIVRDRRVLVLFRYKRAGSQSEMWSPATMSYRISLAHPRRSVAHRVYYSRSQRTSYHLTNQRGVMRAAHAMKRDQNSVQPDNIRSTLTPPHAQTYTQYEPPLPDMAASQGASYMAREQGMIRHVREDEMRPLRQALQADEQKAGALRGLSREGTHGEEKCARGKQRRSHALWRGSAAIRDHHRPDDATTCRGDLWLAGA